MKIFKSLAALSLVVIIIAFSACSKSGSTATTTTPTTPFLSATTTGPFALNFSATDSFLTATENKNSLHPSLTIKGHDTNGDVLDIVVYTYPIQMDTLVVDSVHASAYYTHFPTGGGVATRGTVTITGLTPNITGIFYFICSDLTIVNGSFSVVAP